MSIANTSSIFSSSQHIESPDPVQNLKRRLSSSLSNTISQRLLEKIISGMLLDLSLEGLPATDQDIEILMSYCPILRSCDLSECTEISGSCLKKMPSSLQHLFLRGLPNLTEECLDHLSTLSLLTTLDLSQNHFDLTHLKKLVNLKNLENLYFWQCRVLKNKDIEWLSGKRLKKLDLSFCTQLTDECLPFIKSAKKIYLDGVNYITNEGFAAFSDAVQLETISLSRCRRITQAVISNFPCQTRVEPFQSVAAEALMVDLYQPIAFKRKSSNQNIDGETLPPLSKRKVSSEYTQTNSRIENFAKGRPDFESSKDGAGLQKNASFFG